ncbi:MAG: hypothetical protein V4539_09140 [Bacteroidota bacterium]
MKKSLLYYSFLIPLLFFSCQDKYLPGILINATGTLKNDTNGDCLPKTIAGTYIAGKEPGDTNYLYVTVDVKTSGNYLIKTNEVNGYYFTGSGSFSRTGTAQVKLFAKGKPIAAGSNDFTVAFDTSKCHVTVTVVPATGSVVPTATYILAGTPGVCINAVVKGTYAKGALLDTSNKVVVSVSVSATGPYSITTNIVNGYRFSVSDTFKTTGIQNIVLAASGTPINNGTDKHVITAGSSTCNFPVDVLVPLAVLNNDLLPLTYGSYATYGDDITANPGDTMKRMIIDSVRTNGNLYYIQEEKHRAGLPVQYLYRKAGDTYYEYASVDKYTTSFKYGPQIKKDIPVLKDNLITGDKWSTDEYIGPADFGQTIYFKYDFSCIAGNTAATINGKTFGNVCKILIRPQIRSAVYYPYNTTGETIERWYAKGVGLIYSKMTNNFSKFEWFVRYWEVI